MSANTPFSTTPTASRPSAIASIAMPRLSDSMEEGTIVAWLVADGGLVSKGDQLVEIETDKATVVYEAEADGFLHVLVRRGETAAVGAPIAELRPLKAPPVSADTAEVDAAPRGPASAAEVDAAPRRPAAANAPPRRSPASPVARRLAAEFGIKLDELVGTGPYGRIVKRDVIQARDAGSGREAPAQADIETASAVTAAKGAVVREEPTRLQQLLARRMAQSKATAPDFSVTTQIDMTAALALRAQLKEQLPDEVPSVNDLIVKACALALREHPRLNGSYSDGGFERYERINVGVAVSASDALVVPVVFDADRLSLAELATQTRRLARAVRDGSITPPELSGGTFTISNLGMYGVTSFTAIINPPQAAILAVGATERRPVFDDDGKVVARELMTVTLVSDHRVVYGADAAAFLKTLRELLQSPLRLLV